MRKHWKNYMTTSMENWHFELETGIDMLSFLCSNLFRIVRHHCTLRSEQRMWRWWIFFSTMEHLLMLLIRFAHNSFQLCVLKLNVYFIHLWISKSSGWTWQQKLTRSRFLINLCFLTNYPYPYQWKFFFGFIAPLSPSPGKSSLP